MLATYYSWAWVYPGVWLTHPVRIPEDICFPFAPGYQLLIASWLEVGVLVYFPLLGLGFSLSWTLEGPDHIL